MLVFDTSILIDALHKNEAAVRKILELEDTGETICTTQINVLELYKGAYAPPKSEEGREKVKKLLDAFVILPINEDTYEMFGELSAELRLRGNSIGDFDELIASIALTQRATIVSRDNHFKRIPGLDVLLY
ncbi:MAG: type II toxin-antitoxin system VapC family toxin [Methanotrichaceae archaeon]